MKKITLFLLSCLCMALSVQAQRDVTAKYISNATLANGTNGWTVKNFNAPQRGNNTTGWASEAYAGWDNLQITEYSLTQTITLPKGNYRLANYSFFRQGLNVNSDPTKSLAYLKAGDQQVAVQTLGSIEAAGYADNQTQGANCFDSKMYRNVVEFSIDADNTPIEIGLVGTFDLMQSWIIAGMFELFDMDQTPTEEIPTEVTYAITNSGFEYSDLTGWTLSPEGSLWKQDNASFDNKVGGFYCEKWQPSGALADCSISQTLKDLPAGYYTLSTYCKYTGTGAILFANDAETAIAANKSQQFSVKKKITAGQDLNIGLKLVGGTGNWICVDRFTLTYYPVDLTLLKSKLATLQEDAEGLLAENMSDEARNALSDAAHFRPQEDEDAYIAAIEALEAAIADAHEAIEDYIYQHVTNADPVDLTHLIKNPSYEDDMNGWEKTENQTGSGWKGVTGVDGSNAFQSTYNEYMRHETVYQEGIRLKPGTYRLSARLKGTPKDDVSTFIYATDGAVAHWEDPVFKGNTWYGYLKRISGNEWVNTSLCLTLEQETTLRIGVLSWGNNWTGGLGGAFCVDDWKLELLAYPEIKHVLGDATGNGNVTARDVTALVDALNNHTTDALYEGADADGNGTIDVRDVEAMRNIALTNDREESAGPAVLHLTVFAEQDNAENASDQMYMLRGAENADVSSIRSIDNSVTTLHITAPAGTTQLFVYANGKEAIAGNSRFDTGSQLSTFSDGTAPSAYASGMKSDVVSLTGSAQAGVYTVYLLPTTLSDGLTVTARTSDGGFVSQKFDNVVASTENNLTMDAATATSNWMATVPGSTYFSMLSTPGAHDACTMDVSFGAASQCQDMSLSDLLQAGVRQFDLRPGYKYNTTINSDNLYIWHGITNTGMLYKDAIATLVTFLQANPSEALSIIMTKENNNKTGYTDRSSEMWTVVNAVQEQYKDYMKVLDHSYYTLDDFRGKICYVNRTGTVVPYTTQITNWPDDKTVSDYSCVVGLCDANVQDEYTKYGTDKQTVVKAMLDQSSANTDHKHLYYNYTSSSNSPKTYAKATNPVIASYLNGLTGPTGYVMADFIGSTSVSGGTDLLKAIINQNYKYVYSGRTRVK